MERKVIKVTGTAQRMIGNTATYNDSAFSGIIIKYYRDEDMGDKVLVQRFYPKGGIKEYIEYEEPVVKEIYYNDDGTASFNFKGNEYQLADFMRDNYLT